MYFLHLDKNILHYDKYLLLFKSVRQRTTVQQATGGWAIWHCGCTAGIMLFPENTCFKRRNNFFC